MAIDHDALAERQQACNIEAMAQRLYEDLTREFMRGKYTQGHPWTFVDEVGCLRKLSPDAPQNDAALVALCRRRAKAYFEGI